MVFLNEAVVMGMCDIFGGREVLSGERAYSDAL